MFLLLYRSTSVYDEGFHTTSPAAWMAKTHPNIIDIAGENSSILIVPSAVSNSMVLTCRFRRTRCLLNRGLTLGLNNYTNCFPTSSRRLSGLGTRHITSLRWNCIAGDDDTSEQAPDVAETGLENGLDGLLFLNRHGEIGRQYRVQSAMSGMIILMALLT